MANDGTIDITDLVEQMKESFALAAESFVFTQAIATPGLGWLAWPVFAPLFRAFIHWVARTAADGPEQISFFMNTAIRKASQSKDWIYAKRAKEKLPKEATNAEYERAEQLEIMAFRNFVRVSN